MAAIAATEATVWLHYSLEKYRCSGVLTDDDELDIVAGVDGSRKRASSLQWEDHCKLATDSTLVLIDRERHARINICKGIVDGAAIVASDVGVDVRRLGISRSWG